MVAVAGTEPGLNHQGASWPRLTPEQADMVEANRGLVVFALRKMHRLIHEDEFEDRVQDGMLGLVRAVQLYEPAKGFAFSTYAMHWIRQAIEKGREVEGGRNRRQAVDAGEDYLPPLSMHVNLRREAGQDYSDLEVQPADERVDVEQQALAAAAVEEVRARLASMHLDRIDRAIADDLLTPSDAKSWRARDGATGERVGVTAEAIRHRRIRLQAVLRGEHGPIVYQRKAAS